MELSTLARRLDTLERRIDQIEQEMRIPQHVAQRVVAVPPPLSRVPVIDLDPPISQPAAPIDPQPQATPHAVSPPPPESTAPVETPAPSPVLEYLPPFKLEAPPRTALEQTIGLKWSGWVGAIVLVIGAGLGIKFAYEQGWLDGVPAQVRLIMLYLGGFALIGAGEWIYRRVNELSAVGAFGAGVATLFLVSYAGHGYYDLYARDVAFVLMAISTFVGAAVAMRGRLVSIAVLSLIGGNIAPLVLQQDSSRLVPFLAYLLMLQVVALWLAWWGGRAKWWVLRSISLITTSLWMLSVMRPGGSVAEQPSLAVFAILFAVLYQLELIISTQQMRLAAAEEDEHGGVVFSTFVTVALTAAMLYLIRDIADMTSGLMVLAISGACAAAGFALRGRGEKLRRLSIGYRVQAAVLVIIAAPVALSGWSLIVGWSALAVAFAILGAILSLPISRYAAAATWMLGVLYLMLWPNMLVRDAAMETWLTLGQIAIPAYLVMAAVLVLAGNVVGWLMQTSRTLVPVSENVTRELRYAAILLGFSAAVVWAAAAIAALPTLASTFSFVVYAWLLFAADVLRPRLRLIILSAVMLLFATLKWVVVDTLADRLSPDWSATQYLPVLNPLMGVGMAIAVSMALLMWLRRETLLAFMRDDDASGLGSSTAMLVAAFLLAVVTLGLSVEIDRVVERAAAAGNAIAWGWGHVRQMGWTMLWSVMAAAGIGLARWTLPFASRRRAWISAFTAIALLLVGKFVLIDTLAFRLQGLAAATVLFNMQVLTGVLVAAALLLARLADRADELVDAQPRPRGRAIGAMLMLLLLWMGSLEIDRAAQWQTFAQPWVVRQVGLSIFWSIFAVGCIALGFRTRIAAMRYFGLSLFAVTLLKVVVIDLSQVATGLRILSFMGLGLLLLGTSVLYGRLSPRILALDRARNEHPELAKVESQHG